MPAMRRRLAEAVRAELERRKRSRGLMTYDDLLTRLADALSGPGGRRHRRAAARALPRRARRRVPGHRSGPVGGHAARVRGGHAGADRRSQAGDLRLPRGRRLRLPGGRRRGGCRAPRSRSTGAATRGCSTPTTRCSAAPSSGTRASRTATVRGRRRQPQSPLRRRARAGAAARADRPPRRAVDGADQHGYARKPAAREHIAKDVAADIVRLLDSGATVERERVRPGHVAVLVRTHRQAAMIHRELDAAEVPAVISGAGSVFGTAPARAWLRLLEALERPTSRPAGARARPHARSWAGARSRWRAATRRPGTRSTAGSITGRACCASGASRPSARRSRWSRACRRACSPTTTGSGS